MYQPGKDFLLDDPVMRLPLVVVILAIDLFLFRWSNAPASLPTVDPGPPNHGINTRLSRWLRRQAAKAGFGGNGELSA
jgi:hypothetical protein